MAKSLAELAAALGAMSVPEEWAHVGIRGICADSREVSPGDLFVGIPGTRCDGSDFVPQAIGHGAAAVAVEHDLETPVFVPVVRVPCARRGLAQASAAFYDHPTRTLFSVGVTGTNGKTTTCHWIADVLGPSETALSSTVSNAEPDGTSLTTPPSPILQRMARDAADRGVRHFVVEASSAGIAQSRVDEVDFDAAVFTNFAPEHLHHHHGLESYRRAKLRLFELLKDDAWAVLNADDPLSAVIARVTPARVLTYGLGNDADLRASDLQERESGVAFDISLAGTGSWNVVLQCPGPYNVHNALAAAAVGHVRGLQPDQLVERLAHVRSVPGRGQLFRHASGRMAIVDFAHNAASLEILLQFLRSRYERVVAVLGCPGDGEHEKRRAMGDICGRLCDRVVLTSDNPKHESARAIADEIRAGMGDVRVPVTIVLDREAAIRQAVRTAAPRDIVLLAGKGHERVQLVGDQRVPFSDVDVLQALGFVAD